MDLFYKRKLWKNQGTCTLIYYAQESHEIYLYTVDQKLQVGFL